MPVPVPVPVPGGARSAVERAHHVGEHGDDAEQQLTRGLAVRSRCELESYDDIEDSSALGAGASSDSVEASLLGLRELAGTFGDVEHDRGRSASELVGEVAVTGRQSREDAVGDADEIHGRVVDVESFVIEVHEDPVDHAARLLQAMSNHTRELLECLARR